MAIKLMAESDDRMDAELNLRHAHPLQAVRRGRQRRDSLTHIVVDYLRVCVWVRGCVVVYMVVYGI